MIYDLIVLGGGPAGYCAAERAGAIGKSVLLIEKRALGGVCLNEGCIPSKTLLNSAKILSYSKHGAPFGVTTNDAVADPAAIVRRKDAIVKKLVSGVGAKMKRHGVQVIAGEGTILGGGEGAFRIAANDSEYIGTQLLLATGSVTLIPPIPGLRESLAVGSIWTSKEALSSTTIPQRLCVIGGGVIGMEMASYFSAMGAKVSVVEMLHTIGGPIESTLAKTLCKSYPEIDFRLGCKVTRIEKDRISFTTEDGNEDALETEQILLCIGRRPFTEGLGIETLRIETIRGAVQADDSGRTSVPGVYAAGDINGRSMLAHTAYREAECAVSTMFGKIQKVEYDCIPAVIYTAPEVATVGLTQQQAEQRGYTTKVVTLPLSYSGRFLAETAGNDGFIMLVTDEKSRRILGVHMIGPYSSEIIYGAAFMVSTRMPVEALRRQVFPHPTVGEIFHEALFEL